MKTTSKENVDILSKICKSYSIAWMRDDVWPYISISFSLKSIDAQSILLRVILDGIMRRQLSNDSDCSRIQIQAQ